MDSSFWSPVWVSVSVSSAGVAATLPLALLLGHTLARRRFPGKTLLETAVNLSLVMPPVAVGYLLLTLLGRRGVLGTPLESIGVSIAFTWWAAVVAAGVVGLPLMVRSIRLGFEGVDPRLEQAARTLGATPWDAFLWVTLPLAWRGVVAGVVLAFARGLGEFGATILFAGNTPETRTIPIAVYTMINRPDGSEAAAWLVGVSVAIAGVALAVSERLARGPR